MKIFDVKNNTVILNEHILLIEPFKKLYEKKNGLKYIAYCYYMTCPYEDDNPFVNIIESEKKNKILKYIGLKDIPEEYINDVNTIISLLNEMYETPIVRLYNSVKNKINDISEYLNNTKITDKNIRDIKDTIKSYKDIIEPYKSALNEVISERQSSKARGNQNVAYDQ